VDLGITDHGECAGGEQAAQIAIALLANAAELVLAPAWYPGCLIDNFHAMLLGVLQFRSAAGSRNQNVRVFSDGAADLNSELFCLGRRLVAGHRFQLACEDYGLSGELVGHVTGSRAAAVAGTSPRPVSTVDRQITLALICLNMVTCPMTRDAKTCFSWIIRATPTATTFYNPAKCAQNSGGSKRGKASARYCPRRSG
jgi:hypothetical protein